MQDNVKLVQQAYADFAKGNVQGIADLCTEDIVWGSYDNAAVPYAGMFKGKKGVLEFFARLGESIEYSSFEPREFTAQGDTVFVLGHHAGKVRKNGKTFGHDWGMIFKFRGPKVYSYFAFVDTLDQAQAFEGAGGIGAGLGEESRRREAIPQGVGRGSGR